MLHIDSIERSYEITQIRSHSEDNQSRVTISIVSEQGISHLVLVQDIIDLIIRNKHDISSDIEVDEIHETNNKGCDDC